MSRRVVGSNPSAIKSFFSSIKHPLKWTCTTILMWILYIKPCDITSQVHMWQMSTEFHYMFFDSVKEKHVSSETRFKLTSCSSFMRSPFLPEVWWTSSSRTLASSEFNFFRAETKEDATIRTSERLSAEKTRVKLSALCYCRWSWKLRAVSEVVANLL